MNSTDRLSMVGSSSWWPRFGWMREAGLFAAATLVILVYAASPALASEGYGVTATFGAPGSGQGQLSLAPSGSNFKKNIPFFGSGLAVNNEGDVYVADTENNRVEWFSAAGHYEGQFDGKEIDGVLAGRGKEAPTRLSEPEGIAIDDDSASPSFRDVYVISSGNGVVDKFSAQGEFLYQLPIVGEFPGIATDPSGDVWVTIYNPGQAEEFSNAIENKSLTSPSRSSEAVDALAVDSEDNLYMIIGAGSVVKADRTLAFLGSVCASGSCPDPTSLAVEPGTNDLFVDTRSSVQQYGPFGEPFEVPANVSRPGILANGAGIAVNPASHEVYVADAGNNRIDVLTLGSGPEVPETLPPSEVESKSAIFRGTLEPPSTKLKYYFEYNIGSSCEGGSKTPVKEGEGTIEEEVTGLEPSAEYTYCIVAENAFAITSGSSTAPFSTPPAAPEIIRESASSAGLEVREFAAAINPENEETTYSFEYSTEGSVSNNELTGEVLTAPGEPFPTLPAEFGERTATVQGIPTESINGSLYYRVVATNKNGGTTTGAVEVYTMLPLVENENFSALTSTTVKLEATVNPDFAQLATKYSFEYAPEAAELGTPQATVVDKGEISEVEVSGQFPVNVVLVSLRPGATYYYRAVSENEISKHHANANEGKPIVGPTKSFKTFPAPTATTGEAGTITGNAATLSGTVDPEGVETNYSFEYITETGYQAALAKGATDPYAEGEATTPVSAGSGEVSKAVGPVPVGGLLPGETYRYRLVATSKFGEQGFGKEATFTTTSPTPPLVNTGAASGVSQNSATLSGTVGTNGLQTNYGFEVGTAPGIYSPATGLGAIGGSQTEEVHVTLGELEPGTTYYYRVTASNADGTVPGQPATFTTPSFPTLLVAPMSLPVIASPNVAFPTEEPVSGTTTTPKTLTKAQKLNRALKACRRDARGRRAACEKAAHRRYGPAKRKKRK